MGIICLELHRFMAIPQTFPGEGAQPLPKPHPPRRDRSLFFLFLAPPTAIPGYATVCSIATARTEDRDRVSTILQGPRIGIESILKKDRK
jgi:hypothetical protein